jgi:hypothetical protein
LLKLYEEYFLGTKAEHNLPIILTDDLIAFLSTELLAFPPDPATLLLPRRAARHANDASSRQAPVAASRPRCGNVEKENTARKSKINPPSHKVSADKNVKLRSED